MESRKSSCSLRCSEDLEVSFGFEKGKPEKLTISIKKIGRIRLFLQSVKGLFTGYTQQNYTIYLSEEDAVEIRDFLREHYG